MLRLRAWVALLALWVALALSFDRLQLGASDTRGATILFHVSIAVMIAAGLGLRKILRLPRVPTIGALATTFIIIREALPLGPGASHLAELPVALTEAALVCGAGLLAWRVAAALDEFERAVWTVLANDLERPIPTLTDAQDWINREMARARRHSRPLTVTVLRADPNGVSRSLPSMLIEMQHTLARRYLMTHLARLISQRTRRTDLIIEDAANHRFILVSPESMPDQVSPAMLRLGALARRALHVTLECGSAGFPADALTFDDLVERAALVTPSGGAPSAVTDARANDNADVQTSRWPARSTTSGNATDLAAGQESMSPLLPDGPVIGAVNLEQAGVDD